MKSLSIKWRISIWITAVIITVITVISYFTSTEFEESHLRNIERTLIAMSDGIVSSFDTHTDKDKWKEEVIRLTAITETNFKTLYRIWFEGESEDLINSNTSETVYWQWLHELEEHNKPLIGEYNYFNIKVPHNEYRFIWLRYKVNENVVNIVVGISSHFTYHELSEFLRLLFILGTCLVIASFIATIWTVRCNLLVPINIVAKRLQGIENPNIKEVDFGDIKVPVELRPFVQALNDMFERLNNVLQLQQQFTSDAAHELRTPLSLIKSTLQASQLQNREPEQYRQIIEDALEDIARMEHLIEQLLVLARLEKVEPEHAASEVELDVLLRELAETYGKKMEKTGGKIVFDDSPNIIINGNLDELIRLFSNILDNAVKYGLPNGTIRLLINQQPDNYIKICVHDEGGNIPKEALAHLFDRFYMVDTSRSKQIGGTGLGLAIVREIVRRHNGDISITSSPESGTLVCIRLPIS